MVLPCYYINTIMSKGSLFWANASGKLGESVFYRSGGEQRNRTYVKKIKNPKTAAQMAQRLKMVNLVETFKSVGKVLGVSFPNRTTAQSSWNKFCSMNAASAIAIMDPADKNSGICVPVDMVVSSGSLTTNTSLCAFKRINLFDWKNQEQEAPTKVTVTGIWLAGIDFANVEVEGVKAISTSNKLGDLMSAKKGSILPLSTAIMNDATTVCYARDFLKAYLTANGYPSNTKVTQLNAYYDETGFRLRALQETLDGSQELPAVGNSAFDAPAGWATQTYKQMAFVRDGNAIHLAIFYQKDNNFPAESFLNAVILSFTDASGKLQVTTSKMCYSLLAGDTDYVEQFMPPSGELYMQILESNSIPVESSLATARSMKAGVNYLIPADEESSGEDIPPIIP